MAIKNGYSDKDKELGEIIARIWSATSNKWDNNPFTSGIPSPSGDGGIEIDYPISDAQILQSYVNKYQEKLSLQRPKLSAVIGQPDFQPASFLKLGVDKSRAVCRILTYYSSDSLKEIFNHLRETFKYLSDKFPGFADSFNFPEELKVIFSIPTDLFDNIFGKTLERDKITYSKSLSLLEANVEKLLWLNPFALGTGFLVGGSHLLTNCHVLPSREVAKRCVAQFGYEDLPGNISTIDYDFDPDLLFVSNPNLDYTLVQLKFDASSERPAGYNFGWLSLTELEDTIFPPLTQTNKLVKKLEEYGYSADQLKQYGLQEKVDLPGDQVVIVQHPRGRKKEIVLHNNEVTHISSNNLTYEGDTDYGSSGSPVFNMNWELVAITKKVIAINLNGSEDLQGSHQEADGSYRDGGQNIQINWVASQGTRSCRIVEDLKKKSFSEPKLRSFIEDFVVTTEQLNYPPLPAALEFDGKQSYVRLDGAIPSDSVDFTPRKHDRETENLQLLSKLTAFTIEAWVNPYPAIKEACIVGSIDDRFVNFQSSGTPGQFRLGIDDFREGSGKPIGETYAGEYKSDNKPEPRLPLGKFNHVAFVFTTEPDITGYERIYINGHLIKSDTKSRGGYFPVGTPTTLDLTLPIVLGATLRLSRQMDAGKSTLIEVKELQDFFAGSIAEVRLWKTALEEAQIQTNLYRRLNGDESGLIGYWRLDEGEGIKVYNLAPELNSYGQISSAKWLNASQINSIPLPAGLKFSEADDHVNCGQAQTLNATSAAITIEAWIKHKFGDCVIVSRRDNSQAGYSLSWIDGRVQVSLQSENFTQSSQNESSTKNTIVATRETIPQDKMWHHLAFTWEQQTQEISIYIDGRLQDCVVLGEGRSNTIISAGRTQTIGLFSGPLSNLTSNLVIGRKEKKETYRDVAIAEVRLWNVARTQDQIKLNMSRRLSERDLDWSDLIGYWRLDDGSLDEARNLKSPGKPGKVFGATPFPPPPTPTQGKSSTPTEPSSSTNPA